MPRTKNPYLAEIREQIVALAQSGRSLHALLRAPSTASEAAIPQTFDFSQLPAHGTHHEPREKNLVERFTAALQ